MKNEPAFPLGGLTKREYFAAMAMQGLISNPQMIRQLIKEEMSVPDLARDFADGMLKELERTESELEK